VLRITICVGSSCSVRGSEDLAESLERLIEQEDAAARVEVVGSFCMGECSRGISVKVGETLYREVMPPHAEQFFRDAVLPQLESESTP